MKLLAPLALLMLIALPVLADESTCPGGCPLSGVARDGSTFLDGYDCSNACPLAQRANHHRAAGSEAVAVSPVCQKDLTVAVARKLEKI